MEGFWEVVDESSVSNCKQQQCQHILPSSIFSPIGHNSYSYAVVSADGPCSASSRGRAMGGFHNHCMCMIWKVQWICCRRVWHESLPATIALKRPHGERRPCTLLRWQGLNIACLTTVHGNPYRRHDVCGALIQSGVPPTLRDKYGEIAADWATNNGAQQ